MAIVQLGIGGIIMRGVDPNEKRRYVVEDERELPVEEQTVFFLKHLSLREKEQISNSIYASETTKKKGKRERLLLGTWERLTLEIGLVGWENFKDAQEREIPFSKENIDCIPARFRAEIAVEIRGESDEGLTEEEGKN